MCRQHPGATLAQPLLTGTHPALPTTTGWWLLTPGPHTNTPVALLQDLGTGVAVLGLFPLITRLVDPWLLPLVAMSSMALTLYSAHLPALTTEAHDDHPCLWFLTYLGVAVIFALAWRQAPGQGSGTTRRPDRVHDRPVGPPSRLAEALGCTPPGTDRLVLTAGSGTATRRQYSLRDGSCRQTTGTP